MKHRAPTAPGRVRRAAVTVIKRTRRQAAARMDAHYVPRHATQPPGHPDADGVPAPTAEPRSSVGFGVVAAVATLGVIPVVTGAPSASLGAPAGDAVGAPSPTATAAAGTHAPGSHAPVAPTAAGEARATAVASRVSRHAEQPAAKPPAWVHPIQGAGLTSCYGGRSGVLHAGVDFAAPAGTPVRAAGAGQVLSAGWTHPGYGMSVLIRHSDGFLTHYAHLAKVSVRAGERVTAGRLIGREGSTGDSTGPHLHFEVHRGLWQQVNPAPWLRARGVRVGC